MKSLNYPFETPACPLINSFSYESVKTDFLFTRQEIMAVRAVGADIIIVGYAHVIHDKNSINAEKMSKPRLRQMA